MGRRGYDEEQVDALLDAVSHDMIRLLEENEALRQRAAGDTTEPPAPEESPVGAELAEASAALDLALRQRARAEENIRQLREQLDRTRRESADAAAAAAARPRGKGLEAVLALANRAADDHLDDATQTSDTLLAEARQKSTRILQDARSAAEAIDEDIRRRREQDAVDLRVRRTALLDEIDQLTELAKGYHAALASQMARQTALLEDPGR